MDATVKPVAASAPDARPTERPSRAEAEQAVRTLIRWAGDNPDREGMHDTPARVARAYAEIFAGYGQDPEAVLSTTFSDVGGYDDIVLLKDIPFFSHCEHHMVPFFGHVHIAYLPHEGVVGLSKLGRLVDIFARRLQTQETMTAQSLDALNENLNPRGAAIMVEAEHMCMSMRGVLKPGVKTVTHRFSGVFAEEQAERDRFFAAIRG